jgi:hypothetical protein
VGVALNDQKDPFSGNLCLHKGSHVSLQDYLRSYAAQCQLEEVEGEEYPDINIPRPDLGRNSFVMKPYLT